MNDANSEARRTSRRPDSPARPILPEDAGYDDGAHDLERDDRQAPGGDRALPPAPPTSSHAVRFARDHGLLLAVRGGGHNIAGNALCDGGLMIDLSPMKAGARRPGEARRSASRPARRWATSTTRRRRSGSPTPLGINSTTGVAGLTLGGGFGWLSRKHGMTIDNLALRRRRDRRRRAASTRARRENADLFWALRGGGGNFGVVTALRVPAAPGRTRGAGGLDRLSARRGEDGARSSTATSWPARPTSSRCGRCCARRRRCRSCRRRSTARTSSCWRCCYAGDPAQGEALDRAAAAVRHADRRARRRRCRTPRGSRRSTRCSRRARATTGSRTTSRRSTTACSTSSSTRVDRAARRRSARSSSASSAARRHAPAAGRDGLPAPRRAVRDERARPLGDAAEDAARHRAGRAGSSSAAAPFATGGVYVNFLTEDETDRVRGGVRRELRAAGAR